MASRRQRHMAACGTSESPPKHHELFEGMSAAVRRPPRSRRERHLAKKNKRRHRPELYGAQYSGPSKHHELYEGMSARPPLALAGGDDTDARPPGLMRRISRINNQYGPRVLTRGVGNVARRAIGIPEVRVDRQGDEGEDPHQAYQLHARAEEEATAKAKEARDGGDLKSAKVHELNAKAHRLAKEYHRDSMGRFASFGHRVSRRQAYTMSLARPPLSLSDGAGEHAVEFVVNRGQGMKLQKDLREFGRTVKVASVKPIGSGGRLHITVETDDAETARFLKQWAAQYNAVERPSWAKPEHVRPKAVRGRGYSFSMSRRQAYAMSLAVGGR